MFVSVQISDAVAAHAISDASRLPVPRVGLTVAAVSMAVVTVMFSASGSNDNVRIIECKFLRSGGLVFLSHSFSPFLTIH